MGERPVSVWLSKSSLPSPVKLWVANDGQREPAANSSCSTASVSSAMLTPGSTSGATAAIVVSTVVIARPIASSSSSLFVRRSWLTRREPVASRSKPTVRPSWSAVSVQTRSPTATLPSPVKPFANRSKIAAPSSVSFTTITSPAGSSRTSNAANIRGKKNTGS